METYGVGGWGVDGCLSLFSSSIAHGFSLPQQHVITRVFKHLRAVKKEGEKELVQEKKEQEEEEEGEEE